MLLDLPKFLWAEAIATAVYLYNRTPHRTIDYQSPIELINGTPTSTPMPFNLETTTIPPITSPAFTHESPTSVIIPNRPPTPVSPHIPGTFVETPRLPQPPVPVTPLQPESDPVIPDWPSSETSQALRRGARERRQADHGPGMVPNSQRYQALAVSIEPTTYYQTTKNEDSDLWRIAIDEEMNALHRNETWDVVPKPKDRNVVGSKWGFKIKHKADGSVDRYKARLVAKGFSQQPGTDYDDTYAPVARYDSLRLLLALSSHRGWTQRQMDVKSAFLYGKLDREIYMEIPDGYKESGK
ncbi:hypothetical protein K3495_g14383 [Podosphaera aphanis]|nr:hypothetical protein K3495_g14383 [Podosphaera aphanis]